MFSFGRGLHSLSDFVVYMSVLLAFVFLSFFIFFLVLFVRCHNNINICYFVMVSVTCCLLAYYMYFFVKKFC